MKFISYCNKIIEYSFYSLFLLVPLVFAGDTSELFELNKMWLTFGLTIIIATAWGSKMILERKILIQRTPLDILLMLFLASQIISTLFSLDQQVSWWGSYSRFNGGLLSTISYILLYYAFVSNLQLKHVYKTLLVSLAAGFLTVLWGFPSHFGADPTCFVFRGTFDTACWTDQFKPTVRAFSTLGQPAWFAAYLALLIPLAMGYALNNFKENHMKLAVSNWKLMVFAFLSVSFYINLLFANTRAGLIGFGVAYVVFWAVVFFKKEFTLNQFLRPFAFFTVAFLLCTFILGGPIGSFYRYTLPGMNAAQPTKTTSSSTQPASAQAGGGDVYDAFHGSINITDSAVIRQYVWSGAIAAWQANPIFGTGVETFAFAYYKHKSPAHNLTSEWDYLYNKAHNEYLNYLTTTGIFGLGTYLAFIAFFTFLFFKYLFKNAQPVGPPTTHHKNLYIKQHNHSQLSPLTSHLSLLAIALFAGWLSLLITNFFGFSVVITNIYLFLIPAFVFILFGLLKENHTLTFSFSDASSKEVNPYQWTFIGLLILISLWLHLSLITYRQADIAYAYGFNLDKVGQFNEAQPYLLQAYKAKPDEALFKDELAINMGAHAAGLYAQKDDKNAAQFAQNAVSLSDEVVLAHPNNVVYWKNRVRLLYTLSSSSTTNQQQYLTEALRAIDRAKELSPNDAKISYNQGILHGQVGDLDRAIAMLEETIKLKPDYRDPYVALGLFYHQQAVDKDEKVIHPDKHQKAIEIYEFVLKKIDPKDEEVKKALKGWKNK